MFNFSVFFFLTKKNHRNQQFNVRKQKQNRKEDPDSSDTSKVAWW